MTEKLEMRTKDLTRENIDKIAELFPNCITESLKDGKPVRSIDFDALKQELSDYVVDGPTERYQFTWPGKSKAKLLANSPIDMTLRPCPEESVDFDNTKNLYIEGDNLDVLKLLRETYLGKVKMIYIDPPYNTGSDFVYNDKFVIDAEGYAEISGDYDEDGNRLERNTASNGRHHTDWLNMIYPRLRIARDLLSDDGAIFISIDDNEVQNLRKMCDEIFGEDELVTQFVWKKKQGGGNDSSFVVTEHEYILCYCKNSSKFKIGVDKKYKLDDSLYPFSDNKGDYGLVTLDKASIQFSQSLVYEIKDPAGNVYYPRVIKGKQSCWRWGKNKVEKQYNELVFKNGKVYTKYYRPDGVTPRSLLIDSIYGRTESGNDDIKSLFELNPFSYPKPVSLIQHFISICSEDGSLVMDFFSGSATFAQAVMQLNNEDRKKRHFIVIQLPEKCDETSVAYKAGYVNICEIGKERIRRAGKQIKSSFTQSTLDGKKILDVGFRVLKLDSSNMKNVYYSPDKITQAGIDGLVDNIKEGRTHKDLLFQSMLDLGIELSVPISSIKVEGKEVYDVDNGYLLACFDDNVSESVVTEIAKKKPVFAVMRDSSMDSDSTATNFEQIFRSYSPTTVRKVI